MFYLPIMTSLPNQHFNYYGDCQFCGRQAQKPTGCSCHKYDSDVNNCNCHEINEDQEGVIELPTIGENGHWFIGGTDTGFSAKGEQGIPGERGETGPQGPPGLAGEDCKCSMLTTEINKTINIESLQSEINALPRLLLANVNFTVNPGTCNDEIMIKDFTGYGGISIIGAVATGKTTHNIARLMVESCNIPKIIIQGLTATATNGIGFNLNTHTSGVELSYCNAIAGTNATDSFYGVDVRRGFAMITDCTFSNKHIAIRARIGRANVTNAHGSNNRIAYAAHMGGIIQKQSVGTITGAVTDNYSGGGFIVKSSGGSI
ncbi:MAG: collagen-like protein [Lachnospiraceae bacterium]|nr:collagen-like protein [Lachnospiraceae bacterium]